MTFILPPQRGDGRGEAAWGRGQGGQGQGIHLDADHAIAEGFLQLDGDQHVLGEGDVLGGDGRAKHVAKKVGPAHVVLGAGAGRSMERESAVLDAQGPHGLGPIGSGQGDGEGLAAQLGAGGREARDGGGGELGQGWLALGEVVGEKSGLPLAVVVDGNPGRVPMPSRGATLPARPAGSARVLDDVAADEVAQEPAGRDGSSVMTF